MATAADASRRKLNASLALLPEDPSQVEFLFGRLLSAEPTEVPVIVQGLKPHAAALIDRLWTAVAMPLKGEDAARLRDRIAAIERVVREVQRISRARALARCVLVPAAEAGHVRAYFVAGGAIAAERTLPPGGGAALEVEAGLAAARRAAGLSNSLLLGSLEELVLVGAFLRRPPPELRAVPLEREAILRAAAALARVHAGGARVEAPRPQGASLF